VTTNSMTMLDEDRQQHLDTIILGVDTHKDIHAAAILSNTGALLATATFARHDHRLSQPAELGKVVRPATPSRCRRHRLLRGRAGSLPAIRRAHRL
jgi:hypothetical protein